VTSGLHCCSLQQLCSISTGLPPALLGVYLPHSHWQITLLLISRQRRFSGSQNFTYEVVTMPRPSPLLFFVHEILSGLKVICQCWVIWHCHTCDMHHALARPLSNTLRSLLKSSRTLALKDHHLYGCLYHMNLPFQLLNIVHLQNRIPNPNGSTCSQSCIRHVDARDPRQTFSEARKNSVRCFCRFF